MNLVFFLLATCLSLALGKRLTSLLGIGKQRISQELFLSFGCGWIALALLTTGLGFSHSIYKWLFVCLTFVGLLVLRREVLQIGGLLFNTWRALYRKPFLGVIAILVAIPLVIDLIASLAPPTFMDVVLYHLELPRQYVRAHTVSYIPSIIYSAFPQYVEMIFLFGYALCGEIVSQLLSWSFTLFLAVGVYAMLRRMASQEFAGLATIAFVSMAPIATYGGTAYVDIPTALFTFLASYALLEFLRGHGKGWLLLCGLSAGIAMGAKMSSIFFVGVVFLVLLVALRREQGRIKLAVLYLGVCALVALPWYLHSYISTGNPIFPYFYKYLDGRDWNSLSDSVMSFFVARPHYRGVASAGELALFIWNVFAGTQRVSLILLAFLPVLPLALKIDREIKMILVISFSCLILTSFFVVQARFHLISFALLLVPSILAAAALSSTGRYVRYLCYLVIIFSLIRGLEIHWGSNFNAVHSVLTAEKRESYIQRNFPDYAAMQWMNANLPAGSRVLLWAFSGYYLNHDYVWMGPLRQGLIDFTKVTDAEALIRRMKELGITNVYYRPGHEEVVIPKALGIPLEMDTLQSRLERKSLKLLASFGDAKVFAVNY